MLIHLSKRVFTNHLPPHQPAPSVQQVIDISVDDRNDQQAEQRGGDEQGQQCTTHPPDNDSRNRQAVNFDNRRIDFLHDVIADAMAAQDVAFQAGGHV